MQTLPLTVLHKGLNNIIDIRHLHFNVICISPGRRRTLLGVGLGHLDVAAGHGDHHRPLLGLRDVEQLQRGVETGDVMIVNSLRLRLVDAGQEEGEGPNGAEQVSWGQLCVVGEHVGQVLE